MLQAASGRFEREKTNKTKTAMPSRRLHSTRKLPRRKRLIYDQNGRRIEYYRLQTALQNVAKFESNIQTPLQASAAASTSILDTEANLPGPSKGSSIFVANGKIIVNSVQDLCSLNNLGTICAFVLWMLDD